MTAQDNLEYYARIWQLPEPDRSARVKELLDQAGLWERRKEIVQGWSKGMKQKLAIARVLIHRPSLIFLDEPTSGLDPVAAAALRDDLADLAAREGATVFLTTHNLSEAEKTVLPGRRDPKRQGCWRRAGPRIFAPGMAGARAEVIGEGFTDDLLRRLREVPDVSSVEANHGSPDDQSQ